MTRKKTANIEHDIAGTRGKIEPKSAAEILQGAAGALEKVKEMSQTEEKQAKAVGESVPELRKLLFFGRISEVVNIGGFNFEITTMTHKQQNDLIAKMVKMDNDKRLLSIKPYTLAEVITSVNGAEFESLYEEDSEEQLSIFEMRLNVINQMQAALVERLFDEYEKINKKATNILNSVELGDDVKK